MRDLDLTTLRLFVAVCETGNMARAGEQAHIVGSAISKRLAQLEDRLRTPLLVRKRHGVVPTAAGQTLLEHARGMLDGAARIERDMESYLTGARGQVRVLASISTMAGPLANDVASFLKMPAHSTIQVDLEERLSPEVVSGVRDGLASLGVCWDAVGLGTLQHRPYRSDHLCIVVPRGHPLASRKVVRFEETLGYEHVGVPSSSTLEVTLQRAAALSGRVLLHRIIVGNFEAALGAVRAGLAIGVISREVADRQGASNGLRVISLAEPWAERRFVLCFRDAEGLSVAGKLLSEYLGTRASITASPALRR
ncbi:LysR family transcriptional regulator [Variovorax sp. PBL-E5]|uniref:LysR family transcriptional regulator n=1 Tax=Variovorax sp. PBL-E5 TaxID=434014 RepID=UPI001317F6F5|nr:LysR family transcriptional regulator [Variovorax sp. PBL-E5]VTU33992.1 CysJI operon transcriptional activator [Variovorax sp. PBL-E5]